MIENASQDVVDNSGLAAKLEGLALLAAERQHVADQAAEPLALGDDHAQMPLQALVGLIQVLLEQFCVHADVRQRRLQLMRYLVDEADPLSRLIHLARLLAIEVVAQADNRRTQHAERGRQVQQKPARDGRSKDRGGGMIGKAPGSKRRAHGQCGNRLSVVSGFEGTPLIEQPAGGISKPDSALGQIRGEHIRFR